MTSLRIEDGTPHAGSRRHAAVGWLLAIGLFALFAAEASAAEGGGAKVAAPDAFARIGDAVITQQDYDQAYALAARGRFYHGKPPDAEVAKLQREVGDTLVNEVLLLGEAKRRGIGPDAAAVQQQLDGYDERYRASAEWQRNRSTLLPGLKARLEQQSVLERLQADVRRQPEPGEAEVRAYWQQHPQKFTEPEQQKLSLILLKVDPSSPQAKWDGAIAEGAAIAKRLRNGADFAQLAHLHSGDASAEKGGDLGYVHRGMLPDAAQQAVDGLQPGGISDAVNLLEGVAVFRLDERRPAKLNGFDAVRTRARDLLLRDRADAAWSGLLARLRQDTPPRVDESRYLPLMLAQPASAGAK